jgi:AcrR family transcriptional regulator
MPTDARTAVLDAAAELFDARAYDAVSIGDLTAASGVSNGSIYHHFSSKDGVLAALVVDALTDYQRALLATLGAHAGDARGGVRAGVALHLRWFEDNARAARLIVAYRNAVAAGAGREALRAANRTFLRGVRQWLTVHQAAGTIPEADVNVIHAVVFAPAQELASLWLAGRVKRPPTAAADTLGDAAWAALQALAAAPSAPATPSTTAARPRTPTR